MRQKNETRRGSNLGRARECVCSAADTPKISLDASTGQVYVLRELLSGEYVAHYDPDAHAPNITFPTGFVQFTRDRASALYFSTLEEAIEFFLKPSKITPLRPDGKPNRPLTAWNLIAEAMHSHPARGS